MKIATNERRTALVRADEVTAHPVTGDGFRGLTESVLIAAEHGSVHQEIVVNELAPGGRIPGHLHPFEESFFVLEGSGVITIDGRAYTVQPGDVGFSPIAAPHGWVNPTDRPVRWLEVRAPQPKPIGSATGSYARPDLVLASEGPSIAFNDPTQLYVDHFAREQMSPYGPISIRGANNYSVRHISTRVLVDDVLGARQHILFMAELPPAPQTEDSRRDLMEADPQTKTHFHQYEEVYCIVEGHGLAYLDGETFEVFPGDTILAAVGGSHAVINIDGQPLRWIETQAPRPPEQFSMFWEKDWASLTPLVRNVTNERNGS